MCVSYIADVTTSENRLLRLVVALNTNGIAVGITQLAIGYLIDDYGFGPALWIAAIAYFLALLYIIIPPFLIETVDRDRTKTESKKINPLSNLKSFIVLFQNNTHLRSWRLGFLYLIQCMIKMINNAALSLVLVYGLGPPFCWSSVLVAGYSALITFTGIGKYGRNDVVSHSQISDIYNESLVTKRETLEFHSKHVLLS